MSFPAPLSPRKAAVLAAASPEAMVEASARLGPYMANGRWLGTQNAFAYNVVRAAKERLEHQASPKSAKHFAEWVAASGPVHCLEGWSYLGRSIASLLSGDVDSARHLAYYAELRGAVSLLAASGISILHKGHYVVHSNGSVHRVSGHQTHEAVWLYLKHWSRSSAATTAVGEIVRPMGIALSDWLSHVPGGTPWRPIASQWPRDLGIDIRTLSGDRAARNESSYRPMGLRRRQRARIRDALRIVTFVIDTWRMLEPEAAPFANVDKQLLRLSLERAYARANRGNRASSNSANFATTVEAVLSAQPLSRLQTDDLRKFLVRDPHAKDDATLAFATGSSAPWDPAGHFNILSRAALMLRIATGASTRMLRAAGIEPDQVSFWWSQVGQNAGLWPGSPDVDHITDYWVGIEESLQDLEEWTERAPGSSSGSFNDLISSCGGSVHRVTAMEIVGVIGVVA